VSEPTFVRRQLALKHGATQALDPMQVVIPERVLEVTGGVGVDVAFDAAGVQQSLDAAIGSLRARGALVGVALWEETANVNMNLLVLKEITFMGMELELWRAVPTNERVVFSGVIAYDRVHPDLIIEAIAAKKIIGIEDLVTSKIAIEDVVEKGFQVLLNGNGTEGMRIWIIFC
jgi:threonine dehydrogenase-like Zn-dependent dehydrogenase